MTVIEIRPYRNGWKVFQAPGVEPVFAEKRQATGGKTELIEHAGLLQRSRKRWLSLFSLGLSY